MTLLLLDLDDTLLGNKMESFLPAYLRGLSARLAPVAEPEKMVQALLAATNHMVEDASPAFTLEEKFDAAFFPALDLHRPAVQHLIDTFYRDDFASLAALTEVKPGAAHLVELALARGEQVAIATNPLFPRTAILQRIGWAGLPLDQVPFALIPSYETFHFAKPNPAYLAEFLAQLGWPEEPAVMVGDDPQLDIEPARSLGLPVFWIAEPSMLWTGSGPEPARGGLDDILPWLDCQEKASLMPVFNQPSAFMPVLHSTPAALSTLIAGCSQAALLRQPVPGEWSVAEVLCHLRDVELEVNLPRLNSILSIDNPFIPGQDTDPWASERHYQQQDTALALAAFLQARLGLLELLASMGEAGWQRPARHAIFGPTHLSELVDIMTRHDRLHVRQVLHCLQGA